MSSSPGNLTSPQPIFNSAPITVSNGATMSATHHASSTIPTTHRPLHLNNVLVSPSLIKNLISVRSLTHDNNVSIEFYPFGFFIKDIPTRTVLLRCDSHGELYPLAPSSPEAFVLTAPSVGLWHQRLGHPGRRVLHRTFPSLDFIPSKSFSVCETCQFGKHVRLPFQSSTSVSYVPFQIVHTDVWTSPLSSFSGFKYYPVLIDDFTHYV